MRILIATCAALTALAACAPQQSAQPAPEAAAPKQDPAIPVVTDREGGVIRVAARIPDEDALAPIHCAAAVRAIANGASALEWVGGVAKPATGGGFDATMAYETTFDKRLRLPREGAEPADGGMIAAQSWLNYCDEAGMSRSGAA